MPDDYASQLTRAIDTRTLRSPTRALTRHMKRSVTEAPAADEQLVVVQPEPQTHNEGEPSDQAVRRHPPTSPAKAGPRDTKGRKPTDGPAMTSTAATTAMTAYGRTYSREKRCDVFSAKANSCGVTGGASGSRSAALHGAAQTRTGD